MTSHAVVEPAPEPDNWQEILPAQIDQVRLAAEKWQDFDAAKKAGWKAFGGEEPLMGQHYYNDEAPDYVSGDALDFSQPNNIMFAEIDGKMTLTGVAFVVRIGADESVPAGFAGPLDEWHVHDMLSAVNAATEERPFIRTVAKWWLNDAYFSKGDDRYRLAMVHVWTVWKNPDGDFANYDRTLPYRKLALATEWADGASVDAARGLDLATNNGCGNQLDGHAWIANLSRKQKRLLRDACTRSADRVAHSLTLGADQLNQTAAASWRDYKAVFDAVLTPDQRRRIAAIVEHGTHEH